jgi:hypothetical protein
MYTTTIPGAMTKNIAEPAMASIRRIAENSKSRQPHVGRFGSHQIAERSPALTIW